MHQGWRGVLDGVFTFRYYALIPCGANSSIYGNYIASWFKSSGGFQFISGKCERHTLWTTGKRCRSKRRLSRREAWHRPTSTTKKTLRVCFGLPWSSCEWIVSFRLFSWSVWALSPTWWGKIFEWTVSKKCEEFWCGISQLLRLIFELKGRKIKTIYPSSYFSRPLHRWKIMTHQTLKLTTIISPTECGKL